MMPIIGSDVTSETILQAHIRTLLLDYALKYLTTDHIAFTEDIIAELLAGSLIHIPSHEATDLILEPTLQDAINTSLQLRETPQFDERWPLTSEATEYLQATFASRNSSLSTTKCWDDSCFDNVWEHQRPVSPVLTLQSIRQTPKLGSQSMPVTCPGPTSALLESLSIRKVPTTRLGRPPEIDPKDSLNIRLGLDSDMLNNVQTLLDTAFSASCVETRSEHRVDAFVNADSPPYHLFRLDSPPIFPKNCRPRIPDVVAYIGDKAVSVQESHDIPKLLPSNPLTTEDDREKELYEEHMGVVSGWTAFVYPSSPIPSLVSSMSDVDELLSPSPPNASPLYIDLLEEAVMDEYEIPRSRCIGGKSPNVGKSLQEYDSLNSLLSPLIQPIPTHLTPRVVTFPKSQSSSPRTNITTSMLGQPPSDLEDVLQVPNGIRKAVENSDSDDLESMISRIPGNSQAISTLEPILQERLEDTGPFMMEVFQLPPPNEHAKNELLPCSLNDLVQIGNGLPAAPQFLLKVKGLQSLNIELTWRPFNFGYHVPTHEEVAAVTHIFPDSLTDKLVSEITGSHEVLSRLPSEMHLNPCNNDVPSNPPSAQAWTQLATNSNVGEASFTFDHEEEFLLTNQERCRIYGYPSRMFVPSEVDGPQKPSKRTKIALEQNTAVINHTIAPETLSHADEHSDDSGIFITDASTAVDSGRSRLFTEMSNDAEGFHGPSQDGEFFPDMDVIHFLQHRPPASGLATRHRSESVVGTNRSTPSMSTVVPEHLSLPPSEIIQSAGTGEDPLSRLAGDTQWKIELESHEVTPKNSGPYADLAKPASPQPQTAPQTSSISHRRQSLATFLELRAKDLPFASDTVFSPSISDALPPVEKASSSLPVAPFEIVDRNTLQLPQQYFGHRHLHRYMATMQVIEKRSLVRSLMLPHNAVELVEREDLGGAHLIIDSDTAIYCAPLLALTSHVDELVEILGRISWRFLDALVIFEAFPTSLNYKAEQTSTSINSFSPPVIKAVHKLRRDLSLAEVYFTKCPETTISYAFALTVDQVAQHIRAFGDMAESRDNTGGLIWNNRTWLDIDEQEGECELARVDGMNAFVASMILSQTMLEDFLKQDAEQRLKDFGNLVGSTRIMGFNRALVLREEIMQLPSSSPPTTSQEDGRLNSMEALDSTFV